ncbi:AAA family ATPase [Streptomyces sp. NPDC026672]|uniref:AAA family ATPase n=1 Tax=unclassified Streptomyces TaxID=2593676 RepID=UPI0033D56BA3
MVDTISLHERGPALSACWKALEKAAAGRGGFVVVHGEAGVGKSALLDSVTDRARASGFDAAQVRASYAEHHVQDNIARRLLESLFASLPAEARQALPSEALGVAEGPGTNPPWTPHALAQATCQLVSAGSPRPQVFVIDNVHWMDRGSMVWLNLLLESLSTLPLLVVGSVCDGVPGAAPELLEELVSSSSRLVQLRPLGEEAVGSVLADVLGGPRDAEFVEAAMRATAGNPLLLHTLARLLDSRGIPADAASAPVLGELSADVLAMSMRVRTRRVSDEAFTILRIIAALDGDATVRSVTHITGVDLATVAESCHAMRRLGFLTFDNDRMALTQPLVRNSVLSECCPAVLDAVHAQAASLLHQEGAAATTVARHIVGTSQPLAGTWVVKTLLSAAHDARERDLPDLRVACLKRVLVEPLSDEDRTRALMDLAATLAPHDMADALGHLRQALELSPRAACEFVDVDLFVLLALAGCEEELTLIHRHADDVHRSTLDRLRRLLHLPGHAEPVRWEHGDESVPQYPTCVFSLAYEALAGTVTGSMSAQEATALAQEVLATLLGRGAGRLVAQLAVVRVLVAAGRLRMALRYGEALRDAAESQNVKPLHAAASHILACVHHRTGELGKAQAYIGDGLAALKEWDPARTTVLERELMSRAVQLHLATAAVDEAAAMLRMLEAQCEISPTSETFAHFATARARFRMATGDADGAVKDLEVAEGALAADGARNRALLDWRLDKAVALGGLGRTDDAVAGIGEHLASARRWGAPGPLAAGVLARVAVTEEADAPALLEELTELVRGSDDRLMLVRVLFEHGRALHRAGETGVARQVLREAYESSTTIDDPQLTKAISREIVDMGGRVPRSRPAGAASLTESERRVAVLAAQGKKNREIAGLLFLQLRTVEIHLTNTYRKLGIDGRSALPAALAIDAQIDGKARPAGDRAA